MAADRRKVNTVGLLIPTLLQEEKSRVGEIKDGLVLRAP